ncbi:hypothetical protein LAZ67_1001342 [Cordylochernes scorpioides]|uniref:Uncharacterized protein n=1 Tax=Cordylochernes scorpioides TaxID=51811 RepID=A0ABY6JWQ3_9ARAC|nr:hypothetical protein LAZ67_1001342 [Cordylochernes scorpioides]
MIDNRQDTITSFVLLFAEPCDPCSGRFSPPVPLDPQTWLSGVGLYLETIQLTMVEKLEYSLAAQAVRRSRRLQGLEPEENIAMVKQETQTKMGAYHFQPFRNPSIFTGERNQNPEKWLK